MIKIDYKKKVKVFAPATSANFVCGYDILGFALEEMGDEVEIEIIESDESILTIYPTDSPIAKILPENNVAFVLVQKFLAQFNIDEKVHITLHKKMPLNSGLGSSAASSVAAIVAVNELFGAPLTKIELLPLAMEGERIACGNAHADNVAPSLMGGIILIKSYEPLEIVELPIPSNIFVTIVHPNINVPTKEARKIIGDTVLLKDAVTQWGNIAGLISSLYQNNTDLLSACMKDILIEPKRAVLIPQFYEIKNIAMENNAIGFGISGSGPSIFALCKTENDAQLIAEKINKHLKTNQIDNDFFISKINKNGAIIVN